MCVCVCMYVFLFYYLFIARMLHYFRNTTCVLIVQLFLIVYIFTLVYEFLKTNIILTCCIIVFRQRGFGL